MALISIGNHFESSVNTGSRGVKRTLVNNALSSSIRPVDFAGATPTNCGQAALKLRGSCIIDAKLIR